MHLTAFNHFELGTPALYIYKFYASQTMPPWKNARNFTEFNTRIKRRPTALKQRTCGDATGGSFRRRLTTATETVARCYGFAATTAGCGRLAAYRRWLSPPVFGGGYRRRKYAETARPLSFYSPHRRVFCSTPSQPTPLS